MSLRLAAARLNFKAFIPHQVSTIDPDRDRRAGEWRLGCAGLLRVDVQMRLASVARIADLRDRRANHEALADTYEKRPSPEVPEKDIGVQAAQDHVVTSKVFAVDLRDPHVVQAVDRCDHDTSTRRDDRSAKNLVSAWIGWHDPIRAKTKAIQCNKVDAVSRPPIRTVAGDRLVEKFGVRVDRHRGAAIGDQVGARPKRRRQVNRTTRRNCSRRKRDADFVYSAESQDGKSDH